MNGVDAARISAVAGVAAKFPGVAQAPGAVDAQQPRRSAHHAARPGLRARVADARGRRHVLHRVLRRRQLCTATMYTATFESMYSSFRACTGRRPGTRSSTRRSRSTTSSPARSMWAAKAWLTGSPSWRWSGVRAGRLAVSLGARGAPLVGLAFSAVGLIAVRARAQRLLQLLHDARHDADDDDLRRVLADRALPAPLLRSPRRCRSRTRPARAADDLGRLPHAALHIAVLLGYAAVGYVA